MSAFLHLGLSCRRRPRRLRRGFTITEVAVAILLIVLVAVASTGALRMGLRTLSGSELMAQAAAALREFREYTFGFTVAQLDALNGTKMQPVMGDGAPLPDGGNLELQIRVTPVSDTDPAVTVEPDESLTRLLQVTTWSGERLILEARWLATEH